MVDSLKGAPASGSSRAEPGASGQARPVVLVVEDDGPVRQMLGQALPLHGHDVELAAGGAEALEIYRQKHIDLVLLDVQMPGMDGPATLKALRSMNADVIGCFMTGWPGDYSSSALLEMSAGLIQKPFVLAELCRLISLALSKRT
jgi:CheY-like chemotaxis protein